MLNSPPLPSTTEPKHDDDVVDAVVRAGPKGAIAVAGIATLIVLAIWLAFYFFVFVPRGVPA
jgi:hypothetical protein